MTVDGLPAQAGGDKEASVFCAYAGAVGGQRGAANKGAGHDGGAERVGSHLLEGGIFAGIFGLLAGEHVFLQMAHGAARLVFVAGRAFFFIIGGFLCQVDLLAGGFNALCDDLQAKLFERGFQRELLGIVHSLTGAGFQVTLIFRTSFFTSSGCWLQTSG